MAGGFSLKVKTKQGQHVVHNLTENTTVGNLKRTIADLTKISENCLHILNGYPPKPLDLTQKEQELLTIGITNGDTLIVEEKIENHDTPPNTDGFVAEAVENNDFSGILLKQIVPADNSCLFTSIGYVLNGKVDTECGQYMRQIIAEHVKSDKESFNEAVLGKPNADYCQWILKQESWGGAIEVSILSNFYGIEIDVVDITNAIINRFGEDRNYGLRVFLLFDGIHYDPLYLESITGGPPRTIFPIEEESIYLQAEQLALEARSARQFTDVNKFTLKCRDCDVFLKGQVEAQTHAKNTGHTSFGEV